MGLIRRLLKPKKAEPIRDLIVQLERTLSGMETTPIKCGLPKEIESIYPECMKIIKATLYPDGGKVWIRKTCAEDVVKML